MKHGERIYNVLFPFWMLMLFPQLWLFILPGNFIIDSLVLILGMVWIKIQDKKAFYRKHILKLFGIGILSDMIGSGYMLIMMVCLEVGRMGDEWCLTLPALGISAICIFVLNYFITFKSCEKPERLKLALMFAVITAPYTFLIPSAWLYG